MNKNTVELLMSKLKKIGQFILLATLATTVLNCDVQAATLNLLVPNSSFEDVADGIPEWTTHPSYGVQDALVSSAIAHSGSKSLKIVDSSDQASLARISQKITIQPGQTYTSSAYVYANSGSVQLYVFFYENGIVKKQIFTKGSNGPLQQWNQISVTDTAPAGANEMAIMVYSPVTEKTVAYIDDVRITPTVSNADFENALAGNWKTSTSGVAISTEQKFSGLQSLKISDRSTTSFVSAESESVLVNEGALITVTAKTFMKDGAVSMQLRFKDKSGVNLPRTEVVTAKIYNQWTTLSLSDVAPLGAASASLFLSTGVSQQAEGFFDQIQFSAPTTYNFGSPILNGTFEVSVFGPSSNGIPLMYLASNGSPTRLLVYNATTGALIEEQTLPGIEAVWNLRIATDQSVYIGTANRNSLFRYIPGSVTANQMSGSQLINTTLPSGMEIVWDLAIGPNNTVFGGTSSSGKVFKFDPNAITKTTLLNQNQAIDIDKHYVRSIAYASDTEMYLGLGTPASLIKFNSVTGLKKNILPTDVGTAYITRLDYIADSINPRLFAKLTSGPVLVYNTKTEDKPASIGDVDSKGVSPKSPLESKVYYTKLGWLYSYDYINLKEQALMQVGSSAVGFSFLKNQSDYFLRMTLKNSKIFSLKLSLSAQNLVTPTFTAFTVPPTIAKIRSLATGPANKIYVGGYLSGGLSSYDPGTGKFLAYTGSGQIENMTTLGQNLFLGVYPGAIIKNFDTTKAWNVNNDLNPAIEFDDLALASIKQDRPFGILAVEEVKKLFVGTIPTSAGRQGFFSVYDLANKQKISESAVITDQSVVSLVHRNGLVFGGTTIYGGLNTSAAIDSVTKKVVEPKIFVWNIAQNKKISEFNPLPGLGRAVISDLTVGVDQKIWGLAEGINSSGVATAILFSFDPAYPDAAHTVIINSDLPSFASVKWVGGKIVHGNDGQVYISAGANLYAYNLQRKTLTKVVANGVSLLTKDASGDLYFVKYETQLVKFEK